MPDDSSATSPQGKVQKGLGQVPEDSRAAANTGADDSADAKSATRVAVPFDQPVSELFRTREKLCAAAELAASGVAEPFKQSVFLYYIARYLVSVYEARYSELPIQVWNEYRNALDHFMRHLSAAGDELATDDTHHLHRMEGHVQRAVLDVTKMICVQSHDSVNQEVEHWGAEVLDLVDGGGFRSETLQVHQKATDLLELAKANDAQLGQYAWVNRSVIERYLDAFFEFDRILRVFAEKHHTLANAKRQWIMHTAHNDQLREQAIASAREEIRPQALRRAFYIGLAAGLPMALLGAAVGWVLSYSYPPPSAAPLTTAPAPVVQPPASIAAPLPSASANTAPATNSASSAPTRGSGKAPSSHP